MRSDFPEIKKVVFLHLKVHYVPSAVNAKKTLFTVLRHQECERVLKVYTGKGYKGKVSLQWHQVSQQRSKTSKATWLKINMGQNVNQGKQNKNTPERLFKPAHRTQSKLGEGRG